MTISEDPQDVAEYASEIYGKLGREEAHYVACSDYMEAQPDVNGKMRAILIDWLVEVHAKYKLMTETLYLAVGITDRYLEKRRVTRKTLQLVGTAAMLIAAKFEEIYPPEVRDFVYITDNAYTKQDILSMEVAMLCELDFRLCSPTMAHFLEQYQRVNNCCAQHRHLLQYILELSLLDIRMLRYTPSHLVAGAVLLSNKLLKLDEAWPPAIATHTRLNEATVRGCARELCFLYEGAPRSTLQAVRKKFSQPEYHGVARLTFCP